MEGGGRTERSKGGGVRDVRVHAAFKFECGLSSSKGLKVHTAF
jgi:hypothetical protein